MNTNRDRVTVAKGDGWAEFIDHFEHDKIEPIGTVRVGNTLEGALGLDHTDGCFVMVKKDGMQVELNQRKVQAAIDALSKVGKPRLGYEVRELYSVRLEPSTAEYLRGLAGGNLAEGISKMARDHRDGGRIRFADDKLSLLPTGSIDFALVIDGKRPVFSLSDEAQRDYFGVAPATGQKSPNWTTDRIRNFRANKDLILEVIKAMLARDPDARVIAADDFDQVKHPAAIQVPPSP